MTSFAATVDTAKHSGNRTGRALIPQEWRVRLYRKTQTCGWQALGVEASTETTAGTTGTAGTAGTAAKSKAGASDKAQTIPRGPLKRRHRNGPKKCWVSAQQRKDSILVPKLKLKISVRSETVVVRRRRCIFIRSGSTADMVPSQSICGRSPNQQQQTFGNLSPHRVLCLEFESHQAVETFSQVFVELHPLPCVMNPTELAVPSAAKPAALLCRHQQNTCHTEAASDDDEDGEVARQDNSHDVASYSYLIRLLHNDDFRHYIRALDSILRSSAEGPQILGNVIGEIFPSSARLLGNDDDSPPYMQHDSQHSCASSYSQGQLSSHGQQASYSSTFQVLEPENDDDDHEDDEEDSHAHKRRDHQGLDNECSNERISHGEEHKKRDGEQSPGNRVARQAQNNDQRSDSPKRQHVGFGAIACAKHILASPSETTRQRPLSSQQEQSKQPPCSMSDPASCAAAFEQSRSQPISLQSTSGQKTLVGFGATTCAKNILASPSETSRKRPLSSQQEQSKQPPCSMFDPASCTAAFGQSRSQPISLQSTSGQKTLAASQKPPERSKQQSGSSAAASEQPGSDSILLQSQQELPHRMPHHEVQERKQKGRSHRKGRATYRKPHRPPPQF